MKNEKSRLMKHVYIVRGIVSDVSSEIIKVFASERDAERFVSGFPLDENGCPEGYDDIYVGLPFEVFPESEEG
jgi:hypothetical protein